MCGIVGYTGDRKCSDVLLAGLLKLEYRGYDSAGIATLNGGSIDILRSSGNLKNLQALVAEEAPHGIVGIGHTRWATHGKPNQTNAHPHTCCTGKIAIVHNGIIENYAELKEQLISRGHKFDSETDSEVIAHLVEEHYQGDLKEAVSKIIPLLDGAYAVAAVSVDEPDHVVGFRKDSPLIVGLGENENYIASATPAVIPFTNKVVYLEDGTLVKINKEKIEMYDLSSGMPVEPKIVIVDQNSEAAEKAGYADFMLKEIHEQPTAVSDTMRGKIQADGSIQIDELKLSEKDLVDLDKVIFVACGTSYHAALTGKYVLEEWANLSVEVEVASEFRYSSPVITDKTLVIAISQSGETADTLAGIRKARERDARVAAIVNIVGSIMSKEAQAVLYTHAGLEIGVAATKTFLSQLIAVYLLGLYLAKARNTLEAQKYNEILEELKSLPEKISRVLNQESTIKEIAEKYVNAKSFLYLGRGVGVPTALEGALKLKEISYIHAEGYPAGEMKHGPIALLDADTPVMAVATDSRVKAKMLSNIQEAAARDSRCIAVATDGDKEAVRLCEDVIYVPATNEFLSPVLSSVALQLFAYYLAKKKGCNVDQPRNLAKSVTVE